MKHLPNKLKNPKETKIKNRKKIVKNKKMCLKYVETGFTSIKSKRHGAERAMRTPRLNRGWPAARDTTEAIEGKKIKAHKRPQTDPNLVPKKVQKWPCMAPDRVKNGSKTVKKVSKQTKKKPVQKSCKPS